VKANQDNFGNLDIASFERNPYPEISEDVQQTLSRLLGYDLGNGIYRRLLCDSDGRLYVSTSVTQGAVAVNSAVTVSLASIQLAAANGSRKSIYIQNLGANAIYVNYGATASIVTGLQIPSGGTFIEDRYLGIITAIALVAGNDVRIVEM